MNFDTHYWPLICSIPDALLLADGAGQCLDANAAARATRL
jgi:hypothetical protein